MLEQQRLLNGCKNEPATGQLVLHAAGVAQTSRKQSKMGQPNTVIDNINIYISTRIYYKNIFYN